MRPFCIAALALISLTLQACITTHGSRPKVPNLVDQESAAARKAIDLLPGRDPVYVYYNAVTGHKLVYDQKRHGKWMVKRHEPVEGDSVTREMNLWLQDSEEPVMPDVATMQCQAAIEAINQVAGPDPSYEFFDDDNGRVQIDYDHSVHGAWRVMEHDPGEGHPIGSLVKLYISNRGGG
jgi:hypothetical protein